MIDIHCHILYGLDDGAETLEESLQMAEQAVADGVHHIFATPHFTNNYLTQYHLINERISELQAEIDHRKLPVTIYPGNEVRLESFTFLMEHIRQNSFHYLGKNDQFILLEQRWNGYDPNITKAVIYFLNNGVRPIIAHPERHPYIRTKPERLTELLDLGAWTQVSVDSMLGKNGQEAEAFSLELLDQDLIHTIASDAHNTVRKINLTPGYDLISERINREKATEIQQRIAQILP